MRSHITVFGLTVAGLVVACSPTPPTPVPVLGGPSDLEALAGAWEGFYESPVTGRTGSIAFTLVAQSDSAYGEVVMVPRGIGRPLRAWEGPAGPGGPQPRSSVLTIRFVRVMAGRVSGTLDPYADPETGAKLFTTFEGRLRADTIAGTFTTHSAGSTEEARGEWRVTRRKA